jgi:hypothetical protein
VGHMGVESSLVFALVIERTLVRLLICPFLITSARRPYYARPWRRIPHDIILIRSRPWNGRTPAGLMYEHEDEGLPARQSPLRVPSDVPTTTVPGIQNGL